MVTIVRFSKWRNPLRLGLQPNLDVGAGPVADAAFVEGKAGMFEVIRDARSASSAGRGVPPACSRAAPDAAVDENEQPFVSSV
jgi:hypothetical protein